MVIPNIEIILFLNVSTTLKSSSGVEKPEIAFPSLTKLSNAVWQKNSLEKVETIPPNFVHKPWPVQDEQNSIHELKTKHN